MAEHASQTSVPLTSISHMSAPLTSASLTPMPLFDMHCHLGFRDAPLQITQQLADRGVAGGLCCTVTAQEYERTAARLAASAPPWIVGIGLHPWWIHEADAEATSQLISVAPCAVGEIGLDFGAAHLSTQEAQVTAFKQVVQAIPAGSVLSLHTVHAADAVLDMLETYGLTHSCTCLFHWFSGSSVELHRAVQAGCYFSVGPLMLRSRRGRDYARQLPIDRLLLETDYPARDRRESAETTAQEMAEGLLQALTTIATLRGCDAPSLAARLADTSTAILAQLHPTAADSAPHTRST